MGRKVLWLGVLVGLALALGVSSAGGRTLATTTITVEVIGKGTVTSSPGGIKCGNGKTTCYLTFTAGSTVDLTASTGGGWSFDSWGDDCTGVGVCTLAAGSDYLVTANFSGPATTMSTLSVTYDASSADGSVTGPEIGPPGSEIDCGSVGPTTQCTWSVLNGSTLTVFQTPDVGDVLFGGWGGACGGTGTSCTVQMNGDQHVSASWIHATDTQLLTVSVTGKGSVKGGGINCPSTCTATQLTNSSVTLTAAPDDGSVFSGWSGDCVGSSTSCTLTMTAGMDVTATFAPANTLTVTVNGNGAVSGGSGAINCGLGATICSANFAASATVSLVATPATGATFTGWTGACGGSATTCTVSMSVAKSVVATFSGGAGSGGGGATTVRMDVVVAGNGTVSGGAINCGLGASACSANVALNSSVTLTATPASGATFGGWGGACAASGASLSCSVSMTAAKSVTATFVGGTSTFALSVAVTGSGTVTGGGVSCGNGGSTCSANVAANTTVTLTATPASGSTFSGWGGACSGTSTTCSVKMSSAKSVTATFAGGAAPGTLTIAVKGPGAVSTSAGKCDAAGATKTCTQKFKAGAKVVLTAAANPAATFAGWGGDCTGTSPTCTLTLTKGRSVTAAFSSSTSPPPATGVVLKSLGRPIVRQAGKTFRVTLRFSTNRGGVARVQGLRAGRMVTSLSLRVGAGTVRIGPFPVARSGLYTLEIRLGGKALRWQACLGLCGAAARAQAGPFVLVRGQPGVTRTGDVWSVTLKYRAGQISDSHLRLYRGGRLLADHHFLAGARAIVVGPFLLGPGSYELRLTAVDPYGRTRSLAWLVALAR